MTESLPSRGRHSSWRGPLSWAARATFIAGACTVSTAIATVNIEFVPVSNPGNAPHFTRGSAPYEYAIGKYEVTNAQYAEFLNAKATDPTSNLALLWNSSMGDSAAGGIVRGFGDGVYRYSVKQGRANNPVVFVFWSHAARFVNWLHNGQGDCDIDTGAYDLLGPRGEPVDGNDSVRSPGARFFLPNEDEWYKAAYHFPESMGGPKYDYTLYPMKNWNTGGPRISPYSDEPPGADAPSPANTANAYWDDERDNGYDDGYATTGSTELTPGHNYLTNVGAYPSSDSFYGTFDQAGNVAELIEDHSRPAHYQVWGGSWHTDIFQTSGFSPIRLVDYASSDIGFRVAMIPEAATVSGCIVLTGTFLCRLRPRGRVKTEIRDAIPRQPPRAEPA